MTKLNAPARCAWRGVLIALACGVAVTLVNCGDDSPVEPSDHRPPTNDQLPAIPAMTDPFEDPVTRSTTVTVSKRASDFAPVIDRAYCDWTVTGQGRYEEFPTWIDCYGDWMTLYEGSAWSDGGDAIPDFHDCFDACVAVSNYCPGNWDLTIDAWPDNTRFVFLRNGVMDPMPNTVQWAKPEHEVCRTSVWPIGCVSKVFITVVYNGVGKPITGWPYIRRDRFWVAKPWESGAIVERTTGDDVLTLTSRYTAGCARAETESFAWTLGASVGAEYKGLKATIEGSITKTFSTTFTVTEEQEKSFEKNLQGVAGKRTCFVFWVLVEQYSFVNKDGTPFSNPNYEFDPGFYDEEGDVHYAFQACGIQEEIGKYVFDLETNELLTTEVVRVR